MRGYKPRRCSKRWLDGDCPDGVLAIIDSGPEDLDRYTIFYAEAYGHDDHRGPYLTYLGTSADLGFSGHGEMTAHQVASFRYRMKHRYARWSDLPEVVKAVVRRDLEHDHGQH